MQSEAANFGVFANPTGRSTVHEQWAGSNVESHHRVATQDPARHVRSLGKHACRRVQDSLRFSNASRMRLSSRSNN